MAIYWYEERWDFRPKKPDPWETFFAEAGRFLLFVIGVSALCAALFGGCAANQPPGAHAPGQNTPAQRGRD